MADLSVKILKKNELYFNDVFIDGDNNGKTYLGNSVKSFNEICTKHKNFNILLAHSGFEYVGKYLNDSHVLNVFSFFDPNNFGMSLSQDYLSQKSDILNCLYNKLADTYSRDCFLAWIKSRFFLNWKYILPYIQPVQYFCYGFPENFSSNEIIIDCGAYTGDTLVDYIKYVNKYFSKYYALEPDVNNLELLLNTLKKIKVDNVEIVNKGAWNKKEKLFFQQDDIGSAIISDSMEKTGIMQEIEGDTIDNICGCTASFIKMDIEGAEYNALLGAENTIKKNFPKLAICIYHRREDLIRIFKLINSYNPDYKYYFSLHSKVGNDAILYAV